MADKKPFGRPTLLNAELIEHALHYIENHKAFGDVVPTVEGMAYELGINKTTIYRWADENEDFSHVFDKLKMSQGRKLLNGGLSNEMNATITKLMLTKHDYSDKIEQDVTSGGKTIAPTMIQIVGIDDDSED